MTRNKWEVIVTNKPPRWYSQTIINEAIMNEENEVIISVILKYKHIAEQVIFLLKMNGWVLDEELEKNPYQEAIRQRDNTLIETLKYKLVLDTSIKGIRDELLKDNKNKRILMFLIDNKDQDRKENEEEMRKVLDDEELKDSLKKIIDILKPKRKKNGKSKISSNKSTR